MHTKPETTSVKTAAAVDATGIATPTLAEPTRAGRLPAEPPSSDATIQTTNEDAPEKPGKVDAPARAGKGATKNNVRKIRNEKMMSKAELARRAGMSTLTIDRVERGLPCRMDTKRKILEALGLKPSDRVMVFGDDD